MQSTNALRALIICLWSFDSIAWGSSLKALSMSSSSSLKPYFDTPANFLSFAGPLGFKKGNWFINYDGLLHNLIIPITPRVITLGVFDPTASPTVFKGLLSFNLFHNGKLVKVFLLF